MIIDLLTQKSILSNISYYDSLSSNMNYGGYNVKSSEDILSWVLTNEDVDTVEFVFTSPNSVRLTEINYDVIGGVNNANHVYKIYTSLDMINWYELPYRESDKYLYRKLSDSYLNLTTKETTAISAGDLLQISFKRLNQFTNEYDYLFNNLEVKHVKIVLSNLTATEYSPVYFRNLQIFVEDFLSDEQFMSNMLEIRSNIFHRQKVFEDQTFFPDMIKNFLTMLETNGVKPETTNLLNNLFTINIIDATQYIGNDIDGIGYDFVGYDLIIY